MESSFEHRLQLLKFQIVTVCHGHWKALETDHFATSRALSESPMRLCLMPSCEQADDGLWLCVSCETSCWSHVVAVTDASSLRRAIDGNSGSVPV